MALPVVRRNANHSGARTVAAPPALDPWREMDELRERMERLTDAMWEAGGSLAGGIAWAPAVDVEEADDAWIVEAELPGVAEKDITIELSDTELSISGNIEERERRGILRRRTRRVGRFDYRIELPGVSDGEDPQATLDQGVLTVRVPKPARAKRRRIEIGPGES